MSGILLASVGNSYGSLPVNTVAPVITGTATIGSTLTTSDGTWTGAPAPTFTYQWQRGVTNISGATNSTYTVQLGDAGNTLRCVVTATNPLGAVSANSANTSTVPLPAIGSALEGGYYAGQIGVSSVATHYLIVAPLSSGETTAQWKTATTSTAGTSSVIDGPTNTADQIAAGAAAHPCANFCNNLVIGGFSDWYMPAQNEQEVCYYNLKPTTAANTTFAGTNPNSVPARGPYTSGNPARTSVVDFQSGGTQAFFAGIYWSSTQLNASQARQKTFADGGLADTFKTTSSRVRAIRRVAV